MLEKLLSFLEDKKIVILGVGLEGKSTYDFLRRNFPEKKLFMADESTGLLEMYPELIEDINLEINMGEHYLKGIETYDLVIKTPGISFKNVDITKFENKITSQLQLFLTYMECFTIGITGTKGKSTTTSLLYQILKDQGKNVFLLGNIGVPIFDKIEKMNSEESIAVLELSSHNLQYIKKSPNIAVLLNLYKEHLDYYDSFEEYVKAKLNIMKYQNSRDIFLYNYDNPILQNAIFRSEDYAVTLQNRPNTQNAVYIKNEHIYCNDTKIMNINIKRNLKGVHHLQNIMFVLAICDILHLEMNQVICTIEHFESLEHRMEWVGTINSIEYYNDSIATIPEATIRTIEALERVNTLIVGGKDRGIDLQEFIKFLQNSNIENIICLPKTGEYIYETLKPKGGQKTYMAKSLEEAVKIAKKVTQKKSICVLSPAASSYGYFKNFEERGNLYKRFVLEDDIKMTTNKKLT